MNFIVTKKIAEKALRNMLHRNLISCSDKIVNATKLIPYLAIGICMVSCVRTSFKEKSDLHKLNLKGNVCLVITREFNIENEKEFEEPLTSIVKFNRFGNILSDNIENMTYTYDDNGTLLAKKKVENIYVIGEGFKPFATYWKYEYDKENFVYKINTYTIDEKNLGSSKIFERNKYHYVVKTTEFVYHTDYKTLNNYIDTIETFYTYYKGNLIKTKEFDGKRILETSYKTNKDGLIEMMHSKDLVIYTDTIPVYPLTDNSWDTPSSYSYKHKNNNYIYSYKYDEKCNVTQQHFCDSTNNVTNDLFYKYDYDVQGNWIRRETYNNLGDLISYKIRNIEYYPEDFSTGNIDYSWEKIESPLEKKYWKSKLREQKEKFYLNEEYVLKLFYANMKEYVNYKVTGKPKITYQQDTIFNINSNVIYSHFGFTDKQNITARIVLDLDQDSYSFEIIKGELY